MKLLAQTNRRYLHISLIALVVSSGALFLGVRSLFNHFADERLTQLEGEIEAFVKVHDTLPVFFQSTSARLAAQQSEIPQHLGFGDTLLFNAIEQEEEPYRRLRFGLTMQGIPYQVDVMQSAVETEDIAEMVLLLNLALIVATFTALFWAQKRMSEQLWQPFNDTLERLRSFRLAQSEPLTLTETKTDEFAELNTALEHLTEKSRQDYHLLKRFTENASHEIQTPLAIIRVKLETLIQTEGLSDVQLGHLYSTQRAAARLSRLQQNLLLLVKIENEQFQAQEQVDFKRLLENKLELLEDFISAKNLRVSTNMQPTHVEANRFLAETLVGNLISNGVKHNLPEAGWLQVQLNDKQLVVTNSGLDPDCPAAELVERFRRSDHLSDGLGLGLAIVQEICEQYGWVLKLGFEKGTWTSIVYFQSV
ncbi:MAG: HAMP domain-containing sensor histidine kinase [Saprospiraceae bacterium]|nr:HAMP domain-containing sensor histidine kinase [Saprospiraceae bacterium]